jgi:hypothetical protein
VDRSVETHTGFPVKWGFVGVGGEVREEVGGEVREEMNGKVLRSD